MKPYKPKNEKERYLLSQIEYFRSMGAYPRVWPLVAEFNAMGAADAEAAEKQYWADRAARLEAEASQIEGTPCPPAQPD